MGEYHGESLLNRSNRNMNSFVVAFSVVACAMGAPTYPTAGVVAPLGYAGGVAHAGLGLAGVAHAGLGYAGLGLGGAAYAGASVAGTPVVSAPAVVGVAHQTYAAGPAKVESRVEYGVVGHQVVQTGVQSVVGGHAYSVGGVEHIAQPAVSYAASVPQNHVQTIALPAPVIPAPPAPYAAIPPAPVPAGFAPADTVVQTKVLAPVRTHTRITPQATNIIPQVNVQKYNVDIPVHIPTPVERIITVNKHVAAPYDVAIPRAVPVAAPYKVHPVQEIVETPHVHHATYETHSAQAVITPVHTPVHAVSNEAVGVAQSVQHVGYAAPAVAHVGYAAGVAHAGLGLAGVSHAGFAHAGLGYAGLAAAAPVAALAHQY